MTHPSNEHLFDHAAGALPRGMALLVACHLTFCTRCRDRVARLETIGGALLRQTSPAAVTSPDLTPVLARLDAAGRGKPQAAAPEADPILPRPLRRAVGGGSATIRWRRLLPGLSDHRLEGDPGEDVRLIRARTGARIMMHTHEGDEATLVLAGSIRDDGRCFGRGDVSLAGAEHDHSPQSAGPDDCICLMVLAGRMHFTGRFGRILNLIS